jgi:hypothetical protein
MATPDTVFYAVERLSKRAGKVLTGKTPGSFLAG